MRFTAFILCILFVNVFNILRLLPAGEDRSIISFTNAQVNIITNPL